MVESSFLEFLAAHSPALLWSSGPDLCSRQLSPLWLCFAGIERSALDGEHWLNRVHKDDRERVVATLSAAAESEDAAQLEYRFRRFDGAFRTILEVARPRLDEVGSVCGFVGACVDVTDWSHDRLGEAEKCTDHSFAADVATVEQLHEQNRELMSQLERSLEMVRQLRAATDRANNALQEKCRENQQLRDRMTVIEADAHQQNGFLVHGAREQKDADPGPSLVQTAEAVSTAVASIEHEAAVRQAPACDHSETRELKRNLIEQSARTRNVNRIASDLLESRLIRPLFEILEGRVSWQSEVLNDDADADLEHCRSAIRFLKTQLCNIVDLSGERLGVPSLEAEHETVFNLRDVLERSMLQAADFAEIESGTGHVSHDVSEHVPELVRGNENQFRLALFYTLSQAMAFAASMNLRIKVEFEGETGRPGALQILVSGHAWDAQRVGVAEVGETATVNGANGVVKVKPTQVASRLRLVQTLCELFNGRLDVELHDDGQFETCFEFPLARLENAEGNQRRHVRMRIESLSCNLGKVLNLSLGGACIECTRVPPTETIIEFDPQVGEDEPLSVPAHVVWSKRSGMRTHEVGLRFLSDSEDTTRRLAELAALHGKRRMIETVSESSESTHD